MFPLFRCEITYLDISLGCPLVHATNVRTIGETGFVLWGGTRLHKINNAPFCVLFCLGCVSKLKLSYLHLWREHKCQFRQHFLENVMIFCCMTFLCTKKAADNAWSTSTSCSLVQERQFVSTWQKIENSIVKRVFFSNKNTWPLVSFIVLGGICEVVTLNSFHFLPLL